jgi:hydroxymethylpyrimidine/phosphomethylpyrimidine kinase
MTVQSTDGLRDLDVVSPTRLRDQMSEVLDHQRVRAIKVGALGSASNVRVVARALERAKGIPSVVDTPMLPTRGATRLLSARAVAALRDELLPRATLLTVNAQEAQTLVHHPVQTSNDALEAALELSEAGPQAVLVKGGHLTDSEAVDILVAGGRVIHLRARRLRMSPVHGAGCTLASLIAGRLARRGEQEVEINSLVAAVRWAKRVHHAALSQPWNVGGYLLVLVP